MCINEQEHTATSIIELCKKSRIFLIPCYKSNAIYIVGDSTDGKVAHLVCKHVMEILELLQCPWLSDF